MRPSLSRNATRASPSSFTRTGGQSGWPGTREPDRGDELAVAGLDEGRHVWIVGQTCGGADRQGPRLSGMDLPRRGGERGRRSRYVAGDKIGDGAGRALVRHVL